MANNVIEKGYNGNLLLKRQRTKLEWTHDQLMEFVKCKDDPIYFAQQYIKITHVDRGLIDLDLYDYQREIIETTHVHRNTICLTGRQMGKACSIFSDIITTEGLKKFGDLQVGDWVFGSDYTPVQVMYVTETMYDHDCYEISFSTGESVVCDSEHLWQIFDVETQETLILTSKELSSKETYVIKDFSNRIIFIEAIEKTESVPVRCISVDSKDKLFMIGKTMIPTHNTTTAVCLILHYVLFNSHKMVALLANKLDASREILSRIQLAYENLPKWLQQGVIEWNKSSVILENGCKIIASATSGSAIRGKSCVGGNTKVKIRNKETGLISVVNIDELARLHSENNIYEIFDGEEFRNFDGIQVLTKQLFLIITEFDSIEATEDHRFLSTDDEWVYVSDLSIGDKLKNCGKVLSITDIGENFVYDPINVEVSNCYLSNSAISHNCSFLYIDECAFVNNWDSFYTSVYPTLSSGEETKMLFTSTSNGLNHFYEFWVGAEAGNNGFNPIKATWERVPSRDLKWKDDTLKSMNFNYEKFAQEYECTFQGSSGTLLSGSCLKGLTAAIPISSKDGLSIYTTKAPKRVYAMICDVSHGKGLDYSTASVIDVSELPYKQVATYRNNNVLPKDFAEIINSLGRYYNDAVTLIENNDIGATVTHIMWDEFEYPNLVSSQGAGRLGKKLVIGVGTKSDFGIRMTTSVKSLGCSVLKLIMEQGQLIIIDKETIGEFNRFSKKGSSYAAEEGCHDDCVMPLVSF